MCSSRVDTSFENLDFEVKAHRSRLGTFLASNSRGFSSISSLMPIDRMCEAIPDMTFCTLSDLSFIDSNWTSPKESLIFSASSKRFVIQFKCSAISSWVG